MGPCFKSNLSYTFDLGCINRKRNMFLLDKGILNRTRRNIAKKREREECHQSDESTDISVTQKLVVHVRFMTEDFVPKTRFLKNPDLSDGKAATILDTLKAVLAEKWLAPPVLSTVFGLGSDGAAVMTGVKGGVSGLMKNENPMHCLAHRLALCTSQAATDIPALKGYQQIITDIYYYFSKSAKRTAGLKEYKTCLKVMYSR